MGCPALLGLRTAGLFTEKSLLFCRDLVFLATLISISLAVFGQTLSSEKRVLLNRKGELLKEIEGYEQKKAMAQETLAKATSLRESANADNPAQARVYADAMKLAQQAIITADKNVTEDRERLDAINRALGWSDSDQPRAVATIVRGHVFKQTAAGLVPFDPDVPVRLGDRISTGDDGFLELQLEDGSEMHLAPKTDFEYQRDVQGILYELFRGELHKVSIYEIGVRGANDQPRYKGLQAIAAVRGTDFTLQIDGANDVFRVFNGVIEVDPGDGRDKVTLSAGQELTVPTTGAVGQPRAFDAKMASRWWDR